MATAKIVYQLNEFGELVGETTADESPLEPGICLIPAGCIEEAPPAPIDGKFRRYADGAWQYLDIPQAVPKPIPVPVELTLEQIKVAKLQKINKDFELALAAATSDYPPSEVRSWGKQEEEARAFIADSTSSTPLLSALATERGIEMDLLARSVVENADLFAAYSGKVIGKRQSYAREIKAAATAEEISAITWTWNGEAE